MDSSVRLQQRLAAATEKDAVLGMFFDSVLAQVGKADGPESAERIRKQVLGEKKQVGFFRYPVSQLLQVMHAGASQPGKDYAKTLESYGDAAVRSFYESPVGRTLLSVARMSPQRVVSSAPASYRAASSFGEYRYEKLGPNAAALVFRIEFMGPSAQTGVARAALQVACHVEPRIEAQLENERGSDYTLRIEW
jgi:uncharacterized protein (TIGR02265 family)